MSHTILAVDDSPTMRALIEQALLNAGYTVVLAEHGQDALDKLAAMPRVSAIVTDLNMPVMDGLEFTREVRRSAGPHAGAPILFLTTEASQERRQQGKDAGATGWIVKPFDSERLVAMLKRVVL